MYLKYIKRIFQVRLFSQASLKVIDCRQWSFVNQYLVRLKIRIGSNLVISRDNAVCSNNAIGTTITVYGYDAIL